MLDYLRATLTLRLRSERGASVVEYALLVASVGLMIGAIVGFQEAVRAIFGASLEANGVTPTP